ncbi:hypothetical protein HDV63DRAFT_384020 [Trichoderma sp. SZMC 28014]
MVKRSASFSSSFGLAATTSYAATIQPFHKCTLSSSVYGVHHVTFLVVLYVWRDFSYRTRTYA